MAPAPSSRKRKIAEVEADNDDSAAGEERVLSHAAQRRLRKRQKTTATDEPLGDEVVGSKVIERTKSGTIHSIWVGNLAFKTTPQALKAFFGEDSGIARVHMPTKTLYGSHAKSEATRGDNKGCVCYSISPSGSVSQCHRFAYVDFTTLEAKEAAIAKSESNLDGRRLLIKDGDSKHMQALSRSDYLDRRGLFRTP
jgi:RNA recognition motif-containing protein